MLDVRAGRFGLRGLYDVKLGRDDSGWMVGDGGRVLRTHNRGVVWETRRRPCPKRLADLQFPCGGRPRRRTVWIAGSPGSVDLAFARRRSQLAPSRRARRAPLERLAFSTDRLGLRRRRFGCILHTADGGQTWEPSRAANAGLRFLPCSRGLIGFRSTHWRRNRANWAIVASSSCRSAARPRGKEPATANFDLKLHEAVTVAGGSQGADRLAFSARRSGARPRSAKTRRRLDASDGRQVSADVLWPPRLPDSACGGPPS